MPKIIQMKNGQLLVTIPASFAKAYELKGGEKIIWDYKHTSGRIASLILSKKDN